MTDEELGWIVIILLGVAVLLIYYAYVGAIRKVLVSIGFTTGEAGTMILVTFLLGSVTIPLFPYNGWWVGICVGGALIPLWICARLLRSGRASLVESTIGIIIVAFVTYFVTRAEEGVGVVADIPLAFAPAIAAGLYSMSTFWLNMDKAAPLAYVSGVVGTIVGADIFRLEEVLAFDPPSDGVSVLSIGGANIFDMVYMTGIIAVVIAMVVIRAKKREEMYGFGLVVAEHHSGAEGLPYAKDKEPSPTLYPQQRRDQQNDGK
ncbi:MAG: DUF1614 domain-containing protein [Candidatus Thermoplasmatota archaeon]|nr:DUF1614 domain-containing protein [Candidatus Thermoplasmatota archaeon]